MDDQNSENIEVTPFDQTETVVSHVSEESVDQDTGQVEDKQERNWRELRKKAEQADLYARELDDYKRRMHMQEELMKQILSAKQPAVKEEDDEFASLSDDDYLSLQQTRKLAQKEARDIARKEYENIQRQQDRRNFKERLLRKYADFDSVVNDTTIAEFEKREPELASKIAAKDDPYEMGQDTYMYIKAMGIYNSDESRHSREVADKLEQKKKSVQSPQVYEKRPMAQAFDVGRMTKDQKQALYQEMISYGSMSPGF